MNKVQIIILAAGKGVRMQSKEPKALTLLAGKPFLKHILDTIKKLDTNIKPIIVVGYKKERIQEVLGRDHAYAEQHEQLGTGHAVMSAKNNMLKGHDTVLVISADQPLVSKETLENILAVQKEKKPAITIAAVSVPDFLDWRTGLNNFGRIIRENNRRVKKIVEYKDASAEEKVVKELNLALYAFDAKWLWENIDKLQNENVQGEYYLTDLVKLACDQDEKIETVPVYNILEALQPNSREELEILEKLVVE
ncbi:NTP transferase domain-containing protein [Candidatus Nomurabacteria bacterium]|nr:NTP transferase domain-containing protein [Candidatus Nomurabacteria bacterium]